MSDYHNDRPIDGEVFPDLLNRNLFAKNLAKVLNIAPTSECLTVSLEGVWGYGKTSTINLVKQYLANDEHQRNHIIIEYNPWLIGNAEILIHDFLAQFAVNINAHFENSDKSKIAIEVAKQLLSYANLFGVVDFIPDSEPWSAVIKLILRKIGSFKDKLSKLNEKDVLRKKNRISNKLRDLNITTIVIIDDLDRLTPKEAFEVLRLVKSVADFYGTTFLLAFDPMYLHEILKGHAIAKPEEYLDKIIQLRLPLPVISSSDLEKISQQELNSLSRNDDLTRYFEGDQDQLSHIYHFYYKSLIKTPRDIKRFFNHLRFSVNQVQGQVAFGDLFGLSLLAIKAANVYELIKKRPDYFVERIANSANAAESLNEGYKAFVSSTRENAFLQIPDPLHKLLIQKLIERLFEYHDGDDSRGRVSDFRRLYTALHYDVPTEYVSDLEVNAFVDGSINREVFLDNIIEKQTDERFFEILFFKLDKAQDPVEVFTVLNRNFLALDRLKKSLSYFSGFGYDPFRQLISINELLFKKITPHEIMNIMKVAEFAPVNGSLVRLLLAKDERFESDKDTVISFFVKGALACLKNKTYCGTLLESQVFYGLLVANNDDVKDFFSNLLDSNEGTLRLIEIMGSVGADSTKGAYFHYEKEKILHVIDTDKLELKVSELSSQLDSMPPNIKAVISSISDGNKYYLADATISTW